MVVLFNLPIILLTIDVKCKCWYKFTKVVISLQMMIQV